MSNSVILEAYYYDSDKLEGTQGDENFVEEIYLIQHKDGSFSLMVDGEAMPLDDAQSFIDSGIEVVQE